MNLKDIFNDKSIEWRSVKMEEVILFKDGYAFTGSTLETIKCTNCIPVLKIGAIDSFHGKVSIDSFITENKFKSIVLKEEAKSRGNFSEKFIYVENGDVLIAGSGNTSGKIGYYNLREKSLLNQRVYKAFFDKSVISGKYLFYYLKSIEKRLKEIAYGNAQPNLLASDFGGLVIPLPYKNGQPYFEAQQIIANFFDEVIGKLDDMKFLSQILYHTENKNNSPSAKFKKMLDYFSKEKDLEKAVEFLGGNDLLKEYIFGIKNRFEETEEKSKWQDYLKDDNYWDKIYEKELGRIFDMEEVGKREKLEEVLKKSEEGESQKRENEKEGEKIYEKEIFDDKIEFKIKFFGQVAKKITDGVHKTPKYIDKGGYPFVSISEIIGGLKLDKAKRISKLEFENIYKRASIEKGDILFGRIGTLGKAIVVDTDEKFGIFVSVGLIKLKKEMVDPYYFKYFFYSDYFYEQVEKYKATGSHTDKLNLDKLNLFKIPIPYKNGQPDLEAQQKIVAYLDKFTELINYQKNQTKLFQSNVDKAKEQILKSVFSQLV